MGLTYLFLTSGNRVSEEITGEPDDDVKYIGYVVLGTGAISILAGILASSRASSCGDAKKRNKEYHALQKRKAAEQARENARLKKENEMLLERQRKQEESRRQQEELRRRQQEEQLRRDQEELRQRRIALWRERLPPDNRRAFPGDPRQLEERYGQPAHLTDLGKRLLGLERW